VVTAAVFALNALVELGARFLPVVGPYVGQYGGVLVAASFLYLPIWLLERAGRSTSLLGLDRDGLRRTVLTALASCAVVLPLFGVGYDLWQREVVGLRRAFDASRLRSLGESWQGHPGASPQGVLVLFESGTYLGLDNRLDRPIVASTATSSARVEPGQTGRIALPAREQARLDLRRDDGTPLFRDELRTGASLTVPDEGPPLSVRFGPSWLLLFTIAQIVVVALPEEVFFRGYVQSLLRERWSPRRRLLGVPFGAAHVLGSALFALIHLASVPAPERLAVFFPSLLFAWLRERTGSVVAPILFHAAANVTIRVLARLYA